METKICSKCKVEKSLDEFHNRKASNDGKACMCKTCIKEYTKNYRENNSEVISERKRLYTQNNKELVYKQRKLSRSKHPETHVEWVKNNPDKVATITHKQIAKRRGWGTPIILNKFFENSHCHHLHTINSKTGEVDHRVCLYVPIELHTSIWHSNKNRETMLAINELVFEWLYTQV